MGLMNRLLGRETEPSAGAPEVTAWQPWAIEDPALMAFLGGRGTKSGKVVTESSAVRNATLFRALNLITGTIGMLPLGLYRKANDGSIQKATEHPVHQLLRVRPNRRMRPYQFKSYMQGRALLSGNAYAYKVPGVRGVQELIPIDPARMLVEENNDLSLRYIWKMKQGGERVFQQDQVLHLRAPWSADGITGLGLLEVASEALGLAEVADEAAARLLKNGSYIGGVLKHPKTLSVEAAQRLREQFANRYTGVENAGRWIVAEEGLDANPLGMNGRDAEGLAQRKHQAEEVSRFTGVPRPLLMFDETSWGSGIEQLGLFFITYCLLPWFVAWEEVVANALLSPDEIDAGFYAKFNEAALLRGSLKDQAEFLSKALGGPGATGYMVPNEAREKMELNPLPGGGEPNWGGAPMNSEARP